MKRTINIDAEDMTALGVETSHEGVATALYYFTWWGSEGYPTVDVHCNVKEREISARFSRADPAAQPYVIVGIWSEDTKSFSCHS